MVAVLKKIGVAHPEPSTGLRNTFVAIAKDFDVVVAELPGGTARFRHGRNFLDECVTRGALSRPRGGVDLAGRS